MKYDVDELLNCWYDLQKSAADSATDGERVLAKEDILSSGNMLIE